MNTCAPAITPETRRGDGELEHIRPGLVADRIERARKAVSARIRAAIASIDDVPPDLADHLNRTIVTGTQCRYSGGAAASWHVVAATP